MGSAGVQGDLWGRRARDWAEQESQHAPLWEAMFDATRVSSGIRFLDAGCGAGGAALLASRRGAIVSGLDASSALIEVARDQVPGGDLTTGDLEALPYEDDVFDAAMAANSVQYAESPVGAVEELRRVVRPGGRVAIGLFDAPERVDYRVVILSTIGALPERPDSKDPFGMSLPGVIESLVGDAGLKVVDSGEVACPFEYEDFEALWRIHMSAGPTQAAVGLIGEDRLREVVLEAVGPFVRDDGSLRFDNSFRWVSARVGV